MIIHDRLFIGSRWAKPAGSVTFDVISPSTEEIYARVPEPTTVDIDKAVAAARRAFDEGPWPRMSMDERASYLLRLVDVLEPRLAEAVEVQINEMGGARKYVQPPTMSLRRQIDGAIALAKSVPTREFRNGAAGKVLVLREPMGVLAAIMPWNAPFVGLIGRLAPALLTGCCFIIKPPSETPMSANLIAEALSEINLPPGVVSVIPGGREIGQYLVSHPGVDKVSFTGSTAAGRIVGRICGENIRPVTLELGGKSAGIVLEDADLEREIPALINATGISNAGQICVATTRILAPQSRYDEIVDKLASSLAALKVGDPFDSNTDFGPLVAERQRDRVEGYIRAGKEEGARLVVGGGRPSLNKGWYVEATVFADVDNSMRIAREEIFGPVLAVMPYKTVDDAVRIANDSDYGLGGGVFTSNIEQGLEVAARIRTGSVQVNTGPMAGGGGPFGGYKQSGVGRVFGFEGLASHYQLKSVSLPIGYTPPG